MDHRLRLVLLGEALVKVGKLVEQPQECVTKLCSFDEQDWVPKPSLLSNNIERPYGKEFRKSLRRK